MWRTRALISAIVLGLLLIAAPALSQDILLPGDDCFEVDHSGDNPFGSPSALRIFITLPPGYAGDSVNLFGSGASGDISGFGAVEPSGLTIVDLPLFSYGTHMIEGGVLDPGGSDLLIDTSGLGSILVDSSEPVCDPNDLVYISAETTTTTVPPETTSTTLVEETTTTTVAEETTTTTVAETTTTTTATEVSDGGGSVWVFPIIGGLILVIIGGAVLWRSPGDPCQEELAAWMAAQSACDKAKAAADKAKKACDEAEGVAEGLEQEKKDVCKEWPPACWDSDDGGWIEESGRPETRITQRDLHMRRMALTEIWGDYQDGSKTAQEVEEAWKEADTPEFREKMRQKDAAAKAKLAGIEGKLSEAKKKAKEACDEADAARKKADEACKKAAAAKAAYDACMGAAAPPVEPPAEPGPTGPGGPTTPPPTGGGTGPGTAPPPTDPPSTPPEDEEEEPVCCPDGQWIGYGWTTGGMLAIAGYESSIMHFVCLGHDRWVTMSSRSFRFGLGLGGETALFGSFMWGVPHATDVPRIWREKAASGFDFDLSFGPSVSKGLKNVIKSAGMKQAGKYLRWAAKQKVPPSALDPRKLKNLKKVADDAGGNLVTGVGRGMQSQGAHPQVIVFPLGAGLQVGAWMKSFATTEVTDFRSCGCPWPQ